MANLLLHSLGEFEQVILAAFAALKPRQVLEIGSESGAFSQRLLQACEASGAKLVVVEPAPSPALVAIAEHNDTIEVAVGLSLDYFAQRGCDADFVLIDGDHNYYTVSNELKAIGEAWAAREERGVIFLHDVCFPSARRDSYYDPTTIPEHALHPHSFAQGVTLDSTALIDGGFRGEGAFAWALHEGGPKNGVLTAVEDFLAEHPGYAYRSIDAVLGLGALTLAGSPASELIDRLFAPYDNALVRRLERNRMELYLKVIALQDAAARR